ncbi:MAG: ABC-2 family transporter protein [Lachnospiraceae bacterium]|nr:ABC-2 family transporter protein [Lachnospiraceae bacterium]
MKLSPYLAFAKKSFLSRSAYRFDHFMGILNTLLRIFIFWGIYLALYNGKSEVDGVTMTMVTTNFILSMGLSTVFCVNDFYLPSRIQNGSIANEMLLPVSIHGRMLADNLGNALFQLVFHFIPAVVISVLVIGIHAPASVAMFALFLLSAIFGYGVLWTISFALQMLAFWLINVWSIMTIKNVFINVLSGSMIPLWFMPDWMKGVLMFTPFSSIYFTPVQIYLGQLSVPEILKGFGIQLIWILVFVFLGKVLWKQGQKKLVVQGG